MVCVTFYQTLHPTACSQFTETDNISCVSFDRWLGWQRSHLGSARIYQRQATTAVITADSNQYKKVVSRRWNMSIEQKSNSTSMLNGLGSNWCCLFACCTIICWMNCDLETRDQLKSTDSHYFWSLQFRLKWRMSWDVWTFWVINKMSEDMAREDQKGCHKFVSGPSAPSAAADETVDACNDCRATREAVSLQ